MCSKFVSVAAADNKDEDNLYSLSPHSLPPKSHLLCIESDLQYIQDKPSSFFFLFLLLFDNFVRPSQL